MRHKQFDPSSALQIVVRHRRWTTRCSEVQVPTSQIPQRPKKRFQSNSDSPISFSTLLFFISKRHKPKQKSGNAGCISRSYHIGRAKDKRFCLLMFSDYRWLLRSRIAVNHENIFERRIATDLTFVPAFELFRHLRTCPFSLLETAPARRKE